MIQVLTYNYFIALEAISRNKLRGILTSLGIVFGVASVISMLAIGKGAQQEILDQMRLLGANNIIIAPIVKQEEGKVKVEDEQKKEKERFSPGLSLSDEVSIQQQITLVECVSQEIVVETTVLREGLKRTSKLVGVDTTYFPATSSDVIEGNLFNKSHVELCTPVCVICYEIGRAHV